MNSYTLLSLFCAARAHTALVTLNFSSLNSRLLFDFLRSPLRIEGAKTAKKTEIEAEERQQKPQQQRQQQLAVAATATAAAAEAAVGWMKGKIVTVSLRLAFFYEHLISFSC